MKTKILLVVLVVLLISLENSVLAQPPPPQVNIFSDATVTDQLLRKAQDHLTAGDSVNALKALENALKFCPGNARLHLDEALQRYEVGDFEGARIAVRTAYRAYPKLGAIFYFSSKARMYAQDYYGAIIDLSMAIYIEPKVISAYLPRGMARYKVGDFQGAIEDLTVHIDSPNQERVEHAYFLRGKARFELGDDQGTMADLTDAIDRNPTVPGAYALRALQHKRNGEAVAAIKDCDAALGLNPQDTGVIQTRAWLFHELNDFESVHRHIALLVEGGRAEYASCWFARGTLFDAEDQIDSAIADYQKCISFAATNSYRGTWLYANFCLDLLNRRTGKIGNSDYLRDVFDWYDDWPKRIGIYLAGHTSDDSLARDARNTKDIFKKHRQECEAYYYIGMVNLIKGEISVAHDYFERVINTRQVDFIEYNFAMEQLRRLNLASRPLVSDPSVSGIRNDRGKERD